MKKTFPIVVLVIMLLSLNVACQNKEAKGAKAGETELNEKQIPLKERVLTAAEQKL